MADQGDKDAGLRQERRADGLLTLILNHPPVNALTPALIAALAAALDTAVQDPSVRAILIHGAGRNFAAGMDPRSFGQTAAASALGDLCRAIETAPKPVTAALHGTCFGAGLELAMACHWRIATETAQLGLPEVNLGLSPGSGGSQRLPRLVGGSAALRLLLDGAPIPAPEALALGLVDRIATSPGDGAAFAAGQTAPRPTAAMAPVMPDLFGPSGALAQARARIADSPLIAPARIIDCVESAALLPFEAGLALESVVFADLAASPQAKGLRAAWVAERRAAQVPLALQETPSPVLHHIGTWALADTATEVILRALGAGLRVTLGAPDRDALMAALNRLAARQQALVGEGRLSEEARDADWARLVPALDPAALAECQVTLVTPAAPDALAADRRVILGGLPGGLPGVGLTLPDQSGGVAELSQSPDAPPALAALALALARRLQARTVFTGPGGPILTRLRRALGQAIAGLEMQGLSRAQIGRALAAHGMGLHRGPLPPPPPDSEAILRACLAALAAEGGRLIDQGTARRPLDVDAVALHAGILPRWEGGPMAWADRLGLLVLRADLWARAESQPALYAVPEVFDRLIREGRPLSALNGRPSA